MSVVGHLPTWPAQDGMSASPLKADIALGTPMSAMGQQRTRALQTRSHSLTQQPAENGAETDRQEQLVMPLIQPLHVCVVAAAP
jgi:hypothetical protein